MSVDHRSFAEKARDGYGAGLPDWVLELALLADRLGLNDAGKRIGYSAPTVSQVINNRYQKGDVARVEGMVRGALMASIVICPIYGEMARNICLEWQARPFSTASSNCVRMYQACRSGCPNSKRNQGEE